DADGPSPRRSADLGKPHRGLPGRIPGFRGSGFGHAGGTSGSLYAILSPRQGQRCWLIFGRVPWRGVGGQKRLTPGLMILVKPQSLLHGRDVLFHAGSDGNFYGSFGCFPGIVKTAGLSAGHAERVEHERLCAVT